MPCEAPPVAHSLHNRKVKSGRGERIRTSDPSVPNRVLYQAEPRPDNPTILLRNEPSAYSSACTSASASWFVRSG